MYFNVVSQFNKLLTLADYLVTLIKRVVGFLKKSLLLEALEIVTCHWGGWVSKEGVTISKQTFRVVPYPSQKTSLIKDSETAAC